MRFRSCASRYLRVAQKFRNQQRFHLLTCPCAVSHISRQCVGIEEKTPTLYVSPCQLPALLSSIESVSYVALRAMESFGISDAFSLSVRRLPWAECGSWEEHPVLNRVPQKDAPFNPSRKSTPGCLAQFRPSRRWSTV